MLSHAHRDPAALPRLAFALLAIALLWPGMQLAELDLGVLLHPDSAQSMGGFLKDFWPPAHDEEFLTLLLDATLQLSLIHI